jgi:hypothetical protein
MELSNKQTQKIESYLTNNYINYVDVRLEVLDHVITDIETLMTENYSFENAFNKVTQKWNSQFKDTTSYYFGLGFSAPKIIINKAKKMYKKFYILLFASYFVPLLIFGYFDFNIKNPSEYNLFIVAQAVIIFCVIVFLWIFLKKENETKTTFSFILKTQSLSVFVGLIVLIIFLSKPKELNQMHIGMLSTYIFSTYTYFYFYKKHKEAVNLSKTL